MSPNPFVGFDPLGDSVVANLLYLSWPALLTLLLVAVATALQRRRDRNRPLGRLGSRLVRPNLWSLPILVWTFIASWRTYDIYYVLAVHSRWAGMAFFSKLALFYSTFGLCLLVLFQIAAVALIDRDRRGLGVTGHARVAMIYAVAAVILDGFLLLCVASGNWRR